MHRSITTLIPSLAQEVHGKFAIFAKDLQRLISRRRSFMIEVVNALFPMTMGKACQ